MLAEEKINSTVSIASYNRKETDVSSVSQGTAVATVDDSITGPLVPAFLKLGLALATIQSLGSFYF